MKRLQAKWNDFLGIALIIIFAMAIYANSLNNQFVYDDEFLIQKNTLIKSSTFKPELFTKNIRYGAGKKTNVYRPLQMLSYKIDYKFWKLNPRGYHITNVFLHILVALAIYFLLRQLFEDKLLAFLTGLLFISHPVHTEAVTYISGRADPLAALFFILAFYLYVKYRKSVRISYFIFSIFMYTLALFSRESTLVFLFILIMYDYVLGKQTHKAGEQGALKGALIRYTPFLLVNLGYLFLRVNILAIPTATKQYVPTTLLERLPGIFSSVIDYFRILIIPFGLHMEYVMRLCPFFSIKTISGVVVVCLSLIAAFKMRKRQPLVCFSIFWFFITFFPVSNIFALNAFMAEHWLYLPSVGFFLLIGYIIKRFFERSQKVRLRAVVFSLSLLCFYGAMTIYQNRFWQDPITLYERILKFSPQSSRVHNSLGAAYFSQGDYNRAEGEFKQAIRIKPTYADAYNNLGSTYTKKGLYHKSVEAHKKAIKLVPDATHYYVNLGNAYLMLGRVGSARETFEEAIRLYRRQGEKQLAKELEQFLSSSVPSSVPGTAF